jgi:hypothetical protein
MAGRVSFQLTRYLYLDGWKEALGIILRPHRPSHLRIQENSKAVLQAAKHLLDNNLSQRLNLIEMLVIRRSY